MSTDTTTSVNGRCGYETGNGPCQNHAGDDGTCHIASHVPESDGYSAAELRGMDPETARDELTDGQLDEWEQWQDLDQQAEENKAELEAENDQAVETLVKSDMGAITNTIDLHGNEVEVALTLNRNQKQVLSKFEDEYDDLENPEEPGEDEIKRIESLFVDFFAVMFRSFNGVDLIDDDEQSRAIASECVEQWGPRACMYALVEIVTVTEEADQELMDSVESFRTTEGGGSD